MYMPEDLRAYTTHASGSLDPDTRTKLQLALQFMQRQMFPPASPSQHGPPMHTERASPSPRHGEQAGTTLPSSPSSMTLENYLRPGSSPQGSQSMTLANIIRPNDPKEPPVRNLANYLSPEDRERSYQARANAEAAQRADRDAMLRLYDTLNNIGRFPTF